MNRTPTYFLTYVRERRSAEGVGGRTTDLQDAFLDNHRSSRAANGERLFSRTGGRRGAEAEGLGDGGGNDIFTHFVPLAVVALHDKGCIAAGLFLLKFVSEAGPRDHVRT